MNPNQDSRAQLRPFSRLLSRFATLALALAGSGAFAATFLDPTMNGHDPQVESVNGTYYQVTASNDGTSIDLRFATTVGGIAGATNYVLLKPTGGSVWAPEAHDLNNTWYLYFSCDPSARRTHVAVSTGGSPAGSDPTGPYTDLGVLFNDFRNKDGTVCTFNGQLYFIVSGNAISGDPTERLYIQKMSSPTALTGSAVMICEPTESWEEVVGPNGGPHVVEGPYGFTHTDSSTTKNFIVYSASGCWTDDYCLGLLTLTGSDPMTKSSWTKSGPVFSKAPGAFGPGHNALFVDSAGAWWNVYHANPLTNQDCANQREIRYQHLYWDNGNKPDFGVPVPLDVAISDASNGQKLYDDFESGSASDWTVDTGTWSVVTDGSKVYKQAASGGGITQNGSSAWTDYSAQTDIKPLVLGSGAVSLSVRVQDKSNRYIAVVDGSSVTIKVQTTAGGQVTLASASYSGLTAGSWLSNVTFVAIGNSLQVFVGQTFIVGTTDSTFTSGGIALSTSGGATAEFDNVIVRAP